MELTKKLKGGFCEIATADNFDIQRFAEPSLTQENGAYLITSAADLQTLAAYVNEGNNCKGLTLKLTQDLDLSGVTDWTPIGTSKDNSFKGTFDGDGKTIRNLTVDTNADKLGLFSYIYKGTVQNLTLEKFSVTNNFNNAFAETGALAGTAAYASTIENVTVIGATVKSTQTRGYVGGLVDPAEDGSKINNCCVQAQVSGGYQNGAIVGDNYGSNTFKITSTPSTPALKAGAIISTPANSSYSAKPLTSTTLQFPAIITRSAILTARASVRI